MRLPKSGRSMASVSRWLNLRYTLCAFARNTFTMRLLVYFKNAVGAHWVM